MEQSTAESFLTGRHSVQRQHARNKDVLGVSEENSYLPSILRQKGSQIRSSTSHRSHSDVLRQPFQRLSLNNPVYRYRTSEDDDVFLPEYPRSPRVPPNFEKSDGRTAKELGREMEKLYVRIKENDRLSRLSYRTASRTSHRSTPHPIFQPVRPLSARPVGYQTTSRQTVQPPIRQPRASSPVFYNLNRPAATWTNCPDVRPVRSQSANKIMVQDRMTNQVPIRVQSYQHLDQCARAPEIAGSSTTSPPLQFARAKKTIASSEQPAVSTLLKKKEELLRAVRVNYPMFESLLAPLIAKNSNELPRQILTALSERHKLLIKALQRIERSEPLASVTRQKKLAAESIERKTEGLKCLSLILQIESRFFQNGTDKPICVGAVNDQLRFLRDIFSSNWNTDH